MPQNQDSVGSAHPTAPNRTFSCPSWRSLTFRLTDEVPRIKKPATHTNAQPLTPTDKHFRPASCRPALSPDSALTGVRQKAALGDALRAFRPDTLTAGLSSPGPRRAHRPVWPISPAVRSGPARGPLTANRPPAVWTLAEVAEVGCVQLSLLGQERSGRPSTCGGAGRREGRERGGGCGLRPVPLPPHEGQEQHREKPTGPPPDRTGTRSSAAPDTPEVGRHQPARHEHAPSESPPEPPTRSNRAAPITSYPLPFRTDLAGHSSW